MKKGQAAQRGMNGDRKAFWELCPPSKYDMIGHGGMVEENLGIYRESNPQEGNKGV